MLNNAVAGRDVGRFDSFVSIEEAKLSSIKHL